MNELFMTIEHNQRQRKRRRGLRIKDSQLHPESTVYGISTRLEMTSFSRETLISI